MKKLFLVAAMLSLIGTAFAQDVLVNRQDLGSGTPGAKGFENAIKWDNNIYHAPQYMPGHPTAATLYPRVIDVECKQVAGKLECGGYNWLPELGRGEYLMIRPIVREAAKPQVPMVITNTIIKEVPVIREVLVEVPVKKKKE